MCFNFRATSYCSYTAEIEHTDIQSEKLGGSVCSDIVMNRSDTVPPLCTAVGCSNREWGPVNTQAGGHRE